MERDLLSVCNVFYASKTFLYFIKKLPCFLSFLRLFHILLVVLHKFLEVKLIFYNKKWMTMFTVVLLVAVTHGQDPIADPYKLSSI